MSNLTTAGNLSVSGNETINGNVILGSSGSNSLIVNSNATFNNSLTCNNINTTGNISQTTNSTLSSGSGQVTLNGPVVISGNNSLTLGTGAFTNNASSSTYNGLMTSNNGIIINPNTSYIGNNNLFNSTALSNPLIANGLCLGTGDGASYTVFNLALNSWNSVGFVYSNPSGPSVCNCYINTRTGDINSRGTLYIPSIYATNVNTTSNINVNGTANISGDLNLSGQINNIVTMPTTTSGKASLGVYWNTIGGLGETDFLNNSQGGVGGFGFYNVSTTTTPKLLSQIDNNGQIISNGLSTSKPITMNYPSTPTFSNTNIGYTLRYRVDTVPLTAPAYSNTDFNISVPCGGVWIVSGYISFNNIYTATCQSIYAQINNSSTIWELNEIFETGTLIASKSSSISTVINTFLSGTNTVILKVYNPRVWPDFSSSPGAWSITYNIYIVRIA